MDAAHGGPQRGERGVAASGSFAGYPAIGPSYDECFDADGPVQPSYGRVVSLAWVEAYAPGLEWVAYDPTNDCPADERHVTVAVGRDYTDVAPVRGTLLGGGGQTLAVAVTMVAPSAPFADVPLPGPAGRAVGQVRGANPLAALQSQQSQQQ